MSELLPTGPFAVGTVTLTLHDPSRPAHLMSTTPGRPLFIKAWYPAASGIAGARELLWAQLRTVGSAPAPVRALLGLLRRRTASLPGVPCAPDAPAAVEPVIYNHGLVSFASENSSLAEELASHGHAVIAIEHREQLAEYRALQRPPAADGIDRIVRERAADTAFVLDRLALVLAEVPGWPQTRREPARVHLVGFSLGGAVSAELAARDRRVASVANLDGGTQGSGATRAVAVPYLMLYSAANQGIHDEALPSHAQRLTAPGTRHLNFHDLAGVVPMLRWTAALGAAQPRAVLRWRNQTVAAFLAAQCS